MLSTNQKAKMINQELNRIDKSIPIRQNKLSEIEFMSMHKEIINESISTIKLFYGIDANKSLLTLPGFYIIHPVQFDEQIDIKFNNLNLKEN